MLLVASLLRCSSRDDQRWFHGFFDLRIAVDNFILLLHFSKKLSTEERGIAEGDGGRYNSPQDTARERAMALHALAPPRSRFMMFRSSICPLCSGHLFAAERAAQVNKRNEQHAWSCDVCGYEFETVDPPTSERRID